MPVTAFDFKEKYRYQNGFDSYFEYTHTCFALLCFPSSSSS